MSNWEELDQQGVDYEIPVDENGIKHVVNFVTKEDGQKVKVVKTVKVSSYTKKVNKRAEERRKRWVKFGKCANSPGIEAGITYQGDDVAFVLGEAQKKQREREEQEKKDKQQIDAMYQKLLTTSGRPGIPLQAPTAGLDDGPAAWRPSWKKGGANAGPSSSPGSPALSPNVPGKYVPPSRRDGSGGPSMSTDEEFTLRVSNVSDETTQDDLYEMFQQFGRLHRVHLVMDKRTGESRGFAFVNYLRKSDAEGVLHAVEVERKKLGLHNFIFNIEWSKSAQQGK